MAQWIDNLGTALKQSEDTLAQADKYGMDVSEAQVRLMEGREGLVKARLALHAFHPDEMRKPIEAGMAIASETLNAGKRALHEKDVRRIGLVVSVFFIGITVAAIWLVIRRLEANGSGYLEVPASK